MSGLSTKVLWCGDQFPFKGKFIDGLPLFKYIIDHNKDFVDIISADMKLFPELKREIQHVNKNSKYMWTYLDDLYDAEKNVFYMIRKMENRNDALLKIPRIEECLPVVELFPNDIIVSTDKYRRIVIRDKCVVYDVDIIKCEHINKAFVNHF